MTYRLSRAFRESVEPSPLPRNRARRGRHAIVNGHVRAGFEALVAARAHYGLGMNRVSTRRRAQAEAVALLHAAGELLVDQPRGRCARRRAVPIRLMRPRS